MGAVLAVVSQKGGVGKTTTAVNLAAAFARRGMKTLLLDVDPQGSVRYGVGLQQGHDIHGFADYLNGQRTLSEIILPTAFPWLRVILAGTVTDEADHSTYQQLISETDVLPDLLKMASARCDVVVVDTPPGLGAITTRVLRASERVLIPLQCEPLALQTTPQILRAIQEIVAASQNLTLDGILLTMYERGNPASDRVVDYVRANLPANLLFETVVPRTTAAADAFAAGQPVVLRDPSDAAAQAYVNLAMTLADRWA